MNDLNAISIKLVNCVDMLKKIEIEYNDKFIFESKTKNKEILLNINYSAFKKVLKKVYNIEGEEAKELFSIYKDLGYIVTDKAGFTKTQWIDKKVIRVFSIRKKAYEQIKELIL